MPDSRVSVVHNALDERFALNHTPEERKYVLERYQLKGHFLRHGHHHLLQLGLGAETDQPHLAAGDFLRQARRFEQRVSGPRVEHRGTRASK